MSALARYTTLFELEGAAAFFPPAALARVGVAMLSLSVLWTVQGATGSFALAGVATGLFAAAEAFLAPQLARLVDTHGQRTVVGRQLPVLALALGVVGAGTSLGLPPAVWLTASALAGSVCPQIGSLAAARWRHLTGGGDQMPTALALEAAVNETGFMVGPVLVTALGAVVHPTAGLVVSAALVLVCTTQLLRRRESEPPTRARGPGLVVDRRLLHRSLWPFFALHLLLGAYFGGIALCLTAATQGLGAGGLAGFLAAGGGLLSLVTGLLYGAVSPHLRPAVVMVLGSLTLTLACFALSRSETLAPLVVLTVVAGGCVAPVVVPAAVQLQRVAPAPVHVQVITCTGSASALGTAVAAPLIGRAVDHATPQAGYLVLTVVLLFLSGAVVAAARARPGAGPGAPRLGD